MKELKITDHILLLLRVVLFSKHHHYYFSGEIVVSSNWMCNSQAKKQIKKSKAEAIRARLDKMETTPPYVFTAIIGDVIISNGKRLPYVPWYTGHSYFYTDHSYPNPYFTPAHIV
jgi:hypothetical protein